MRRISALLRTLKRPGFISIPAIHETCERRWIRITSRRRAVAFAANERSENGGGGGAVASPRRRVDERFARKLPCAVLAMGGGDFARRPAHAWFASVERHLALLVL